MKAITRGTLGLIAGRCGVTRAPMVGDFAEMDRCWTQEDVEGFAMVSWDKNPIHLNAGSSLFHRPIVHGMLCASLFSAVFASRLPGSVYLRQDLRFHNPVHVGDEVSARVEVLRVRERSSAYFIHCTTRCWHGGKDNIVINGTADVLLPRDCFSESQI